MIEADIAITTGDQPPPLCSGGVAAMSYSRAEPQSAFAVNNCKLEGERQGIL